MTFPIDERALANFREKYSHLHPLVFHRSMERASSAIELFEILEGVPVGRPFVWDESKRAWVPEGDLMGFRLLEGMKRRKS